MRVQVRNSNASGLQFTNLCSHFGLNLVCVDAATERTRSEAVQTLVEASIGELLISEGWSLTTAHGQSVHQHRMAADAEAWLRFCSLDGVIKCLTIRHQCR